MNKGNDPELAAMKRHGWYTASHGPPFLPALQHINFDLDRAITLARATLLEMSRKPA